MAIHICSVDTVHIFCQLICLSCGYPHNNCQILLSCHILTNDMEVPEAQENSKGAEE